MTSRPILFALSILSLTAVPTTAAAQAVVQPLGLTDADRLAAAMRRLAVNANDTAALIEAGELSLNLDDLSGAASLFARADKIDPRNGRVKAGMGSILVRAERPGEALRYFQTAESLGLAPAVFASDRGFAYDLLGEQERAQRDYRLALKSGTSDETVRRYALSLGISGKRDLALAQLAPLLSHADRGAWRARAFVLAMAGDSAEASRIATTMMPPGMAAGLQPFFQRIAALPPADRAFAVHFGEVRATPERLADARLTPALAALGPDPDAPRTVLAAVQPMQAEGKRSKRKDRDRARQQAVAVAVAQRDGGQPVSVLRAAPVATVPAIVTAAVPLVQAAPSPAAGTGGPYKTAPIVIVASAPPRAASPVIPAPSRPAGVLPTAITSAPPMVAVPVRPAVTALQHAVTAAPPIEGLIPTQLANMGSTVAAPAAAGRTSAVRLTGTPAAVVGTPSPGSRPVNPPAVSVPPLSAAVGVAGPAPAPAVAPIWQDMPPITTVALPPSAAAVDTVPAVSSAGGTMSGGDRPTVAMTTVASAPPAATRVGEDTVLAQIVANLAIPATELGVTDGRQAGPVSAIPSAGFAEAKAVAREDSALKKAAVNRLGKNRAAPADEADLAASSDRTPPATERLAKHRAVKPLPDTGTHEEGAPSTARKIRANEESSRGKKAGSEGASDKKLAGGKAAAPSALDAKKRAADKKAATEKALADKEAADERKTVRANPERIWVQVAGGASGNDLPRAWAAARAKAPDVFARRTAYTTPLRATNRVLAGPFKTDAEARKFVNQLATKGVSAFTFTSDKGQTVSKLPSE